MSETHSSQNSDARTEMPLTPALRKRLQECYQTAVERMKQPAHDADYVHTLLVECVIRDPGNVTYLDAFFDNLRRKYNNNKRGSLFGFGGKSAFKKAVDKQQWRDALKEGPQVLKRNPWHVATLRSLAQACAACGLFEAELRYLRQALEPNPHDPQVNRHCAQSLTRVGQYDQAITCWHRVDEYTKGGDREAQQRIAELQIEKTQAHRKVVKGEPPRRAVPSVKSLVPPSTSVPESPPEMVARREIPLTRRQSLEQTLHINPTDVEAYLELTKLHVDENRLGEAMQLLARALPATGNELRLVTVNEDVEILRRKRQLVMAEQRGQKEPSPDAQRLIESLRQDLARYELDVFLARARRYPQDWECQFQLGLRLKQVENYREALDCFQKAAQLPTRKVLAVIELGECLQLLRQYDKAMECYEAAVGLASLEGNSESLPLALYRAGVLAAALRQDQAAEDRFQQLVQMVPDYKDAAARLDKIRQMRDAK
jgi:tetratricopeptide (TPR) repeat protein